MNLETAILYRARALVLSWKSSALWKQYDAEMTDDESEKLASRREACAYSTCADQLEHLNREWANLKTVKEPKNESV